MFSITLGVILGSALDEITRTHAHINVRTLARITDNCNDEGERECIEMERFDPTYLKHSKDIIKLCDASCPSSFESLSLKSATLVSLLRTTTLK